MSWAPAPAGCGRKGHLRLKRATAIGFATSLSAATTVDEVDAAIRTGLAPVLDASGATLGTIDQDLRELRLHLRDLIPGEIAARYERLPLDRAGPLTDVLKTGEMLVLSGFEDWARHTSQRVVDDARAAGLETLAAVPLVDRSGRAVAMLLVAWNREMVLDEAILATLGTVAELCEQTLERARATDLATERALRLAELAEVLAEAMSVQEVLEVVTARGPAPLGASATSFGLIDADAAVLRTYHGPDVAEDVRERYTDPPLDAPLAFTEAALRGEPVLLCDFEAYAARYPEGAEVTARLGFGARAALPVKTGSGHVIGSIVHAWAGPRIFDDTLVSTLSTIAGMAGQAIERARLVEQIQAESARHEALASLAELLASARTSDQVASVVAVHAGPVAGASSANLALLEPRTGHLRVHHHPSLAPSVQERYRTVRADAPIPHVDAIRDRTLLVYQDLESFGGSYPHLVRDLEEAGRQACAVVPLMTGRGDPIGALGLAWDEPIEIGAPERSVLADIGELCSQALERAKLSDAEHHLVTTLQQSVLVPLPQMAGLDLASRYLPAARHIGMGGDWYQGIILDEEQYAVIVGDVAGHGITAVGDMAQLKAVMSALVRLGRPLPEVFAETTALLRSGSRSVTATAVVAVVHLGRGELTYAAAGHLPPLMRTPAGEVVELGEARYPLLGVGSDQSGVGTVPFPVGSTLVVYTDGLVERRREAIDRSIGRLEGALRGADTDDADQLASQLMALNLSTVEPDDDVALVVVTRTA